jgi:predicted phosphodiesterase
LSSLLICMGTAKLASTLPETYDELWVLGDLVNYGPEPAAVVDFVKAKSTVTVRGNHDHSIGYDVDPRVCTPRYQKMAETTRQYTASVLNKRAKRNSCGSCHFTWNFEGRTSAFIFAMRSHPTLYTAIVLRIPTTGFAKWIASSRCVACRAYAHSVHTTDWGSSMVVNPGSLGQPKTGKPDACYAVWEDGAFELKSFPYAVDETVGKLQALSFPQDVEKDLITVLRTGSV